MLLNLQLVFLWLIFHCNLIHELDAQSGPDCTSEEIKNCGENALCSNGVCRCTTSFFSPSGSNMDCRNISEPDSSCRIYDKDCVFCGASYGGPCKICTTFLDQEFSCVDKCMGDFKIISVPATGRAAAVCEETITNAILTLPQWAILIIIMCVVLTVVITTIILISLMVRILHKSSLGVFDVEATPNEMETTPNEMREEEAMDNTIRTKRSNSFSFQKNSRDASRIYQSEFDPIDFNMSKEEDEDEIDGDDETIFMYKIDKLRGEANTFLKMLNDMRKRAKELPSGSPEKEQYRKVMRDATRLLYLLNTKATRLRIPPDGMELMKWSEKILKRYLASQEKEWVNEVQSYMVSGHNRTSDEGIFMAKLDFLRDHSDIFLRMLNEMRRRLKEIQPETLTSQNYRKVTKDVTRLLELLNKRPTAVEMPADGLQLVTKSEQLLERYLAAQGLTLNYQQTTALDDDNQQDLTFF